MATFHLEATDVDWSAGEGPRVSGPAKALILAAGGRGIAAPEQRGEGVAAFTGPVSSV